MGVLGGRLEEESGIYFNMKHFEELALEGRLDEAERYLSGFTKMEDNRFTMKIIFEMRKQKFLETLDRYLIMCWPVGLCFSALLLDDSVQEKIRLCFLSQE